MRVNHASILKPFALSLAFMLAATFVSSINTFAQSAEFNPHALGTTDAGFPTSQVPTVIPPFGPFMYVSGAQYGSGGVALRNRGAGAIHVSGVLPPVKAAYIYWSVLIAVAGVIPPPVTSVTLQRLFPLPASAPVVLPGVQLAIGADPCWGSKGAVVFRAPVPLAVANGNGLYQVTLNAGASGLTNGADPWVGAPVFPLFEGASLVIVGTGTGTVAIYDVPMAGTEFAAALTYTLNLPVAATGALTLWDNIGDDGQIGTSRTAIPAFTQETTTINAVLIAGGVAALDNDSDWDGSSGLPLPQLWDDTGHDITTATPAGTAALNVAFAAHGDCLNAIANVVEVH
jgi:hypothetical protein